MNNQNNTNLLKLDNLLQKTDALDVKDENFDKLMFIYSAALKELETKISIIKDEFKYLYNYELIDKIQTRIKTPESILKKMKDKHYEYTYKNLIENINDIAGLRIVCYAKDDIFYIKRLIEALPGVKILKEKDYVTYPKKSGYSSYHIIVEIPVNLSQKTVYVKVEIQIRTVVMDFWANAEHKLKYKPLESIENNELSKELVACAKLINKIDNKMSICYNKK